MTRYGWNSVLNGACCAMWLFALVMGASFDSGLLITLKVVLVVLYGWLSAFNLWLAILDARATAERGGADGR